MVLIGAVLFGACSNPNPAVVRDQPPGSEQSSPASPRTKVLTIGVRSTLQPLSVMGPGTTGGGVQSLNELHSGALVTSFRTNRDPLGHLTPDLPTLENGGVALLPDGRMQVTYRIRNDVTWHDGVHFTAQDLLFSYQFHTDRGFPSFQSDSVRQMVAADAPDDETFVLTFRGAWYRATALGLREFWPLPRHVLKEPFERYQATGDPEVIVNHAYWTTEYNHLGPFMVTAFDANEGMKLEAFDRYFLGRTPIDVIQVRYFDDDNSLVAGLLSGAVDMFPDNSLSSQAALQVKERWEQAGQGTVYVKPGASSMLTPQWRPEVQLERATMDVRVREALYHALDREALSESLQQGRRDLAAFSLLSPTEPLFEATKDGLRRFNFDLARSRTLLQEAGWTANGDGPLLNRQDNRRFRTALRAAAGWERETTTYAEAWRRLGIEVEEQTIPAAEVRNAEYRALFPGWEAAAQANGDSILTRLQGPVASAANGWSGNRGGYDNARATELLGAYRSSFTAEDRTRTMHAVSEFVASELPFLVLYYTPETLGVRKGVKALDDFSGGDDASHPYGTYTRNAHLWDLE
jgi:peptide/nickel transport system substrate-binding protein